MVESKTGALHVRRGAIEKRFFFDDFWLWCVDLADRVAALLYWFDANVIDAIFIDGWAFVARLVAEIHRFFDDFFVDGAVDGVGTVTQDAGWGLRTFVSGRVQEYLLYISLAAMTFILFIALR